MVKVKAPSVNQYGEVLDEYGESALDRKYRNINSAIKRVELPDEPKRSGRNYQNNLILLDTDRGGMEILIKLPGD